MRGGCELLGPFQDLALRGQCKRWLKRLTVCPERELFRVYFFQGERENGNLEVSSVAIEFW
jgi:hypothetical protein